MLQVSKKEGESPSSLLYRFTKRIQQSGILKEARHRRFHDRPTNRTKRRLSALHRQTKLKEVQKARKLGLI